MCNFLFIKTLCSFNYCNSRMYWHPAWNSILKNYSCEHYWAHMVTFQLFVLYTYLLMYGCKLYIVQKKNDWQTLGKLCKGEFYPFLTFFLIRFMFLGNISKWRNSDVMLAINLGVGGRKTPANTSFANCGRIQAGRHTAWSFNILLSVVSLLQRT